MQRDALPLIQRSLQVIPAFLPALQENVYLHTALGDRNAAEYALEMLKLVRGYCERDEECRRLAAQVRQMPWL